jgi:hypothetical protein
MALDAAAVADLFAQVEARAQSLGDIEQVIGHEPRSAPVSLPALAVWFAGLGPARGLSGLDATSVRCEFKARVYLSGQAKDEDKLEQKLLYLSALVLGAYSGAFTLNGEAMAVDLLGGWGSPLEAQPGWLEHDSKPFRVAEITVPVIIDGVWSQSP